MLFYLLLLPSLSFPMCPTDSMPNWASCFLLRNRELSHLFNFTNLQYSLGSTNVYIVQDSQPYPALCLLFPNQSITLDFEIDSNQQIRIKHQKCWLGFFTSARYAVPCTDCQLSKIFLQSGIIGSLAQWDRPNG